MKLKDKRGFTLIELMAVIVIIAALTAIAVPSVIAISNRIKTNMYCTKINILESNAKMWGQDHMDEGLQVLSGNQDYNNVTAAASKITVQKLIDGGYVKNDDMKNKQVLDPRDNSVLNNIQVIVYVKNKRAYAKIPSSVATCDN